MNTADKQVQALFDIVQQKKVDIVKAEKPNWETNCAFRSDINSSASQNIQILTKIEDLVAILAFLLEKEAFYQEANDQLGTKLKFEWQGFTLEEWRADLTTRIKKLEISKTKKELEGLEQRLNALISPEVRRQMEIDAITAELNQKK